MPHISEELVIEALDIHKSFGDLEILKGISLQVRRGEVVVLIGASGSGKTTFIRCINLLEDIQSGQIRVSGQPMGYRTRANGSLVRDSECNIARQRRDIGMVFQRFNLFAHMTALENIIEAPIHVLGVSRTAALARRGHQVQVACDLTSYGRGQIILRDPETGVLCGGTEPRTDSHIAVC